MHACTRTRTVRVRTRTKTMPYAERFLCDLPVQYLLYDSYGTGVPVWIVRTCARSTSTTYNIDLDDCLIDD